MRLPIDARCAPFKPKYLDFETTLLNRWTILGKNVKDATRYITDGTDDIFEGLTDKQAVDLCVARETFCDTVTRILNGGK